MDYSSAMPYEATNELLAKAATALKNAPDALSDRLMRRMLTEIPELRGDQRIVTMLGASVTENVTTVLPMFEVGLDLGTIETPSAAIEYARRLAQRGKPMSALLRAYQLGQENLQQRMIE